jgi:hypothetical protein
VFLLLLQRNEVRLFCLCGQHSLERWMRLHGSIVTRRAQHHADRPYVSFGSLTALLLPDPVLLLAKAQERGEQGRELRGAAEG